MEDISIPDMELLNCSALLLTKDLYANRPAEFDKLECRPNTNSDCSVFEYCLDGVCTPDNRGGTCPPDEICVNKKCIPHPLQPLAPSDPNVPPQPTTPSAEVSAAALSAVDEVKPEAKPAVEPQARSAPKPSVAPAEQTQPNPTTPSPSPCKSGWTHIANLKSCYYMKHGSFNYHQANRECQAMGSYLATVRNQEEMHQINGRFLTGLISRIILEKHCSIRAKTDILRILQHSLAG
ncbi:unnamed protein product [Gongylonema pulchrum]|uniref:C-type lectin domain-containing protein n=1 Tax=Gongylonema pulchrum TaxID=637853 RepID=A0A183E8T8_9BILA|nr:unnamed protein product [Gongylonema pulchrum]